MIFTHPRLVLDGRTCPTATTSDSTLILKMVLSLRLAVQSWGLGRCLTDDSHCSMTGAPCALSGGLQKMRWLSLTRLTTGCLPCLPLTI
nr:MAG TPA: hypothetical protein [Caudoviricetes sp.]